MKDTLSVTRLLVSCWIIGGDEQSIPTSHGLLDRALKSAVEHDAFPDWMREYLHFVDARVGLQCVELPAILEWAQMAGMTSVPNPSYQKTIITISKRAAQQILTKLEVSDDEALRWGETLHASVKLAESELATFDSTSVEEY